MPISKRLTHCVDILMGEEKKEKAKDIQPTRKVTHRVLIYHKALVTYYLGVRSRKPT